ncbi:hypothetical protein [Streptomyces sp. NPDC056191]|uniref:hypothetical protein n=1 Tax=Streptomyces sp. NPDC056191 TaxID=3345742 RepID=UPI0035DEB30F
MPVLEIGSPGEHTLGLSEHGLAQRCTSSADVVEALSEIPDPHHPPTQTAKDGVCRWRGDSADQVAQLVLRRAGHAMR